MARKRTTPARRILMMGRAMGVGWLGFYSKSCIQSPGLLLSFAPIQALAVVSWKASTASAAANPTPERILASPSPSSSSSSSSACADVWDGEENEVPSGAVGVWSCTVAFGRAIVGGAPAPPGLMAPVGAEVANRIVGAGDMAGAPAVRRGIVGAGAGGRGGPPVGVGGAPPGTGGLTGGAMGTVADGTDGGASAAFKVTRTVSFLRGTLDVCLLRGMLPVCLLRGMLPVCLDGGWLSFSLMRSQGFVTFGTE